MLSSVLVFASLVNWDTVWRANTTSKFQVSTELNRNVGLLRLFPGITAATVRAAVSRVVKKLLQICCFTGYNHRCFFMVAVLYNVVGFIKKKKNQSVQEPIENLWK